MSELFPTADEIYEEGMKKVTEQETYEFQSGRVLEELRKINKDHPTAVVIFKALPDKKLLEELEEKGFVVKFDAYYDSTKLERYNCKMRITNPKFSTSATSLMDKLEDQMKGCAFSQSNVQVSEDARKFFEGIIGSFK